MNRGALAAVVVALLVVAGLVGVLEFAPGLLTGSHAAGRGGPGPTNGSVNATNGTIAFTSSVDGHPLSYAIWYPPNYDAQASHTFVLFLHGVESSNECANVPSYTGGASLINAATGAGWVVGSMCTRVADGWYVNSPSTGPEETDVLDAIAHEKTLTHVTDVYLVGMSMGSDGALSIATNHPGLVAGVAAVATCADFYEEAAYYSHAHGVLPPGFAQVAGVGPGVFPEAGSVGFGLEYHLSAFRFYPENLSATRLYIVAGGEDQTCIDNTQFWPWMQANNTVLTASCNVAAASFEPNDCSTPIASLAASHSGEFLCRFVYEPASPHTFDQLNGADLVAFFEGQVGTGTFNAPVGGTPTPVDGVQA